MKSHKLFSYINLRLESIVSVTHYVPFNTPLNCPLITNSRPLNENINFNKEPSINDVIFKGEGGGVAKMGIWGNFQGLTEATGEGKGVKKREN